MKKLSIIIPVYNEQQFVWQLLQKVYETDVSIIDYEKEIVIVNDGSADASEQIIQSFVTCHDDCSIQYISKANGGKWSALKAWFAKATGDLYIIQDADLEYDPSDYIPLIQKIEQESLDFVYGSRTTGYMKYGARYSTLFFLAGWLALSLLTSLLGGVWMTDEPTCYKLFTSKLKKYLISIPEDGFEREPAITMLLLRKWYKYGESPIRYYPRPVSQWKKIKLKDGWIAIKTLLKYRFTSWRISNLDIIH